MKESNKILAREITDPAVYFNRRTFMRAGILAASAVATGTIYRHLNPVGKGKVNTPLIQGVSAPPVSTDASGFRVADGQTSLQDITHYNNFYEFSTDKEGVAPAAAVSEPVVLIRINRLYRPGMTAEALYEATRGVWPLGVRRLGAKYALAVFEGVVRQAYEIHSWHQAGTTPYRTRTPEEVKSDGRWEFLGAVAESIASKYCGGSVASYLSRGAQFPVTYLNC